MIVLEEQNGRARLDELDRALEMIRREVADRSVAGSDAAQVADDPGEGLPDLDLLAVKAEAIYRGRRARETVFRGFAIFADPAWDILLDLFVARVRQRRVSVSGSTVAASVPPTTALRWIGTLLERDLLRQVADPDDRRRAFLELTDRGFALSARAIAAA